MHSKKVLNKTLYHLFVVLFGFVMVYPVLWMVSGSFKGNAEILRGTLALIPNELKLDNYATGWKGFGGTTFGTFFKNSIFITVVATFGTVLSSSLVAYALSRIRFRGSKFWFTCMLITMMLPGQVIMIPQYLIYYRLGLVPGYAPLILPYFCGQAFFIYQMMQFMQGIPRDLDESACIDGCGSFRIFWQIDLPLMKPALATVTLYFIVDRWNEWFWSNLLFLDSKMWPMQLELRQILWTSSALAADVPAELGRRTYADGMKAAAVIVTMLPIMCVYPFLQKYFAKGVMIGAIKS